MNALAIAAAAGGRTERDRLVEIFMPSIRAMARHYRRHPRVETWDLHQAGVLGLLSAVERFDASLETPLWAYASWWVRAAMQQVVAELSTPCVLSDRALRELARVRSAEREHAQATGHGAHMEDLAAMTDLPRPQLEALLAGSRPSRGLDEPIGAGADITVGELIADPAAEDPSERALMSASAGRVRELVDDLEPRERTVVHARFLADEGSRTLGEIGADLGLSAERVRQIEQRALDKLRAAIG